MRILGLLIGLSLSCCSNGGSRVWRIMPVGDSITAGGKRFEVYRYPLWKKLKAAGYKFEFVGSKKGQTPAGVLAHEGHGGKNTKFLADRLKMVLAKHPADILLIHSGHNSFAKDKPVPGIVAATERMISGARAANPKIIVLLAQVITSKKLPKYSYIPELNKELAKLAKRLNTAAQPVVIVDQATGFDPTKDTVADKVHPNKSGAEKMAARWFDALTKILPKVETND